MNILNYSYFSELQLMQAAKNIVHSLKEVACLSQARIQNREQSSTEESTGK